ncbi:hypothetical protein HNO92_004012 [Chromobacterium alkanivorans]|nr:hypothetical protein [Chromobacterium alkanivorans]MCS3803852.1 hypothetical protein [Chromobacterium alkanivorans]MCS3818043.1 hypothetical protein [Chromobacterium alkanivorans]MCS3875663.1 hypothetical protein [Chromobacterium alkanivorans]
MKIMENAAAEKAGVGISRLDATLYTPIGVAAVFCKKGSPWCLIRAILY